MNDSTDESIRLNKHLALQLGVSRREADELIERGRVTINGVVATLGGRLHTSDTVLVNGEPIMANTAFVYLAFHKPTGYVCSRRAQGDSETIYELIPPITQVGRTSRQR